MFEPTEPDTTLTEHQTAYDETSQQLDSTCTAQSHVFYENQFYTHHFCSNTDFKDQSQEQPSYNKNVPSIFAETETPAKQAWVHFLHFWGF